MYTTLISIIVMITTKVTAYTLPVLPYPKNALEPFVSEETIKNHYDKHFAAYVNNLNKLIPESEYEGLLVEEIVQQAADGPIYNNAGQVLNHTLYFQQFTPTPSQHEPDGKLAEAIRRDFGNFENFKDEMTQAASTLFGSGWAWLAMDKNGKLTIVKEANGGNPIRQGMKPLLGFDVWEHAYYLDYQNRRTEHLANLWKIIDWQAVENRM